MRQNLSEVKRRTAAELRNLFSATEAVGGDDGRRPGGFDGGEQTVVGDGLGNLEFVRFKAKRSGHAAAACPDGFDRGPGSAEERDLTGWAAEDSLVVAVAVDQNVRALQAANRKIRRLGCKPIGEEPDLTAELLGAGIVGEELEQFVLEDAGAAWFKEDEGQPGFDLNGHTVQDAGKISTGGCKESEVIEGPAAADVSSRHLNAETCLRE